MDQLIKLKDLQDLLSNKHKYFTNEVKGHIGIGEHGEEQGEYNELYKFYKHPGLPEGMFMRETYQSDSYNDNLAIVHIDFVEGKAKTVTVFEPI